MWNAMIFGHIGAYFVALCDAYIEVIPYHNWEYCITNWSSMSILVAMMFYF